jgi:hypothetical protein
MTQARQEGAGGKHPAKEDLTRFMRGELAPSEASPLVRHLLAGCAKCLKVTRELWSFGEGGPKLGGWSSPLQPVRRVEVWP